MTDDMQADDAALKAMSREWLAARIIGGLMLVMLVAAIGVFFWLRQMQHERLVNLEAAQKRQQQAEQQQQAQQGTASQRAAIQFCVLAAQNAMSYGIVPQYAQLASGPRKTDVTGRYICQVKTKIAKYDIAADFICADLSKHQCVNLYSVTQDDASVLYQRQAAQQDQSQSDQQSQDQPPTDQGGDNSSDQTPDQQ